MRRLAIASVLLAALLLSNSALANVGNNYERFTRTADSDTKRHVMWVVPDSIYAPTWNQKYRAEAVDLNNLKSMLERAGCEVHVYTYRQLKADMRLWRFAGNLRCCGGAAGDGGGYAIAIVTGLYSTYNSWGGVGEAPLFRADSTTTHIIQYGSSDPFVWDEGAGGVIAPGTPRDLMIGHHDFGSNLGGTLNHYTAGASRLDTTLTVTGSPSDTFYYDTASASRLYGASLQTGASKVVRLFNLPGQDSLVVGDGEWAHIAYRVYYTNANYAGLAKPYTDYVTNFGNNVNDSESQAFVLWALASRWVYLPTIKVALMLQGLGSWGGNPWWAGRSASNLLYPGASYNWAYPRATYIDTLVKYLYQRYHVTKLTITTQPDSLAILLAADPSWAVIKRWDWVKWSPQWASYDSLSQFRSPNGVVSASYGDTTTSNYDLRYSRRVANRFRPGDATVALRYGIAQSFAPEDSILKALGLKIDYAFMPLQITGASLVSGGIMPLGPFDLSNSNLSPAESTFSGYANAGRLWLIDSNANLDYTEPLGNDARYSCRVATNGRAWSIVPDETYRTYNGRLIRFLQCQFLRGNTMGATSSPSTSGRWTFAAGGGGSQFPGGNVNRAVNLLFGMTWSRPGVYNPVINNSKTAPFNGFTSGPPFGGAGRCRVVVCPLRFVGNDGTDKTGNQSSFYAELYLWEIDLFKEVSCMESLAGHRLIEWVYPEDAAEATP